MSLPTPPRVWVRAGLTVVIAALALMLAPATTTWTVAAALAGGALLAAGTRMGLALGVVAAATVATLPPGSLPAIHWAAVLAGALGLGGAARLAEDGLDAALSAQGGAAAGLLLCALAAAALVLPDDTVHLASAEGLPAAAALVVRDTLTLGEFHAEAPLVVEHIGPTGPWDRIAMVLVAAAGVALVAAQRMADKASPVARVAWSLAFVAGALVALVGMLGLAELLIGSVAPPDPELLRHRWSLDLGVAGTIADVSVPAGLELRLWSRPAVEALRLLAGGLFLAIALTHLVAPRPQAVRRRPWGIGPLWGWPAAVAAGTQALLVGPSGLALSAGAAACLLVASLVAGRHSADSAAHPGVLACAALGVWVVGWVGTAAGWLPA